VLAVVAAVLVVPPLRSPTMTAVSVLSPLLVLLGMWLHRPASVVWWLLALMLALWGAASVLVQRDGDMSGVSTALVGAGQAVGALLTVHVARVRSTAGGAAEAGPRAGSRVDVALIVTVLGLVGAQLVTAGTARDASLGPLLVPIVDVTILGVLLRYTVSHRGLQPASYLALTAAVVTTVYDLSSALQGRRLALPGEPAQALGICCLLLFGVAALHPTMTSVFSAETFARRQRPSGALLGLLPLAVVPVVLWWVADRTGTPGLPPWVLLVAGGVVSGLSLVRAAQALRTSEHLAERDPLTDLANRRGLERAFREPRPPSGWSMLLIDLDEFKQVNDTHGHDVGDRLLLQVRDRLLLSTGATGLVARLGGDEFVVLVPSDQAVQVVDRVLRSLVEPMALAGLEVRTTASVGLASAERGTTLTELLTRADVAMYSAKAAGRNRMAVFRPSMRVEVARRFSLTSEVRQLLQATPADVGRLEIHYQPLVELRSGEVVGSEALVRWRHPERGLLAPDAFLGVVSSSGLDTDLDTAVLRAVLDQLAEWRRQGRRELPVSVNLTAASLADPGLAARVTAALAAAGVPGRQLHLEITEHEELARDSPAERSLRDLRALGIHTYLDDYGEGYTSLDYLTRFPIEVLKLDRCLVASMDEGTPLVAGVAAMAAALDLDLLAEGVETEQQRDQLLALGVRYAQGWLFSRSLPADEFGDRVLGLAVPRVAALRQRCVTAEDGAGEGTGTGTPAALPVRVAATATSTP